MEQKQKKQCDWCGKYFTRLHEVENKYSHEPEELCDKCVRKHEEMMYRRPNF